MIVSIHSFRGGTGKSNTTANIAAQMAAAGYRVGVVDADIQSPGLHVLFGMDESDMGWTLNDFLWQKCGFEDVAHDVTARLGAAVKGQVHLVPSSIDPGDIARILREGYDVAMLSDGLTDFVKTRQLDVLLIDTHPGLNGDTLLSIALSDQLLIVLRPDQQDYQGTKVTVHVARQLEVPGLQLLVNKLPEGLDVGTIRDKVEAAYDCEVAAVIPHNDEMMLYGSQGIFSLTHPEHEISRCYAELAAKILEAKRR